MAASLLLAGPFSRALIAVGCGMLACRPIAAQVLPAAPQTTSALQATLPIITLSDAIHLAQQNEPGYATAVAEKNAAQLDHSIAKAALLPSASYHNQLLYTQPNGLRNQAGQVGSQASPIFIANNAVHEYASQAVVNETLGAQQIAAVHLTAAAAARADAELEIARRGLVAGVVALYYGVSNADRKVDLLAAALKEANGFTDLAGKREQAREAAHADVVKAELQQQQRQRDLMDAQLLKQKNRLELAVLLFPDPHTPYSTEPEGAPAALPGRSEIERAAAANNAEMKSALAALHQSDAEVLAARAGYLPDLALNFNYGIDAPQFAKRGPDNAKNLGYSFAATVDLPVWDWFSTQHRIKQSTIRRDAVKVALTNTQRHLLATLDEAYDEAVASRTQIDMLDQSSHTAEESLRLTKLRYSSGEGTVLEVVDAENQLLAAQTAQADGTLRYRNALANLQTLTGTL